jgi:hypothetical protein
MAAERWPPRDGRRRDGPAARGRHNAAQPLVLSQGMTTSTTPPRGSPDRPADAGVDPGTPAPPQPLRRVFAVLCAATGMVLLAIGATGYQPVEASTSGQFSPALWMCIIGGAALILAFVLFAKTPQRGADRGAGAGHGGGDARSGQAGP